MASNFELVSMIFRRSDIFKRSMSGSSRSTKFLCAGICWKKPYIRKKAVFENKLSGQHLSIIVYRSSDRTIVQKPNELAIFTHLKYIGIFLNFCGIVKLSIPRFLIPMIKLKNLNCTYCRFFLKNLSSYPETKDLKCLPDMNTSVLDSNVS